MATTNSGRYIHAPQPSGSIHFSNDPRVDLPRKNIPLQTSSSGDSGRKKGIDGEKLLICALLMLLLKEGADMKLLLALAYIMM